MLYAHPVSDRTDRDTAFAFAFALVVLAFVAVGWRTSLRASARTLQEENALLHTELVALRKIAGSVSPEQLVPQLERRIAVVEGLSADRGRAALFLGAVEQSVPRGAWLTQLRLVDTSLSLTGRSDDTAGAAEVMDGLRRTSCFDNVTLASVSGGVGARTFAITAQPAATCGALGPASSDPFRPPIDPEARPDLVRPALYRWEVEAYDVVALVPGQSATLRDPDGGTHRVEIGSAIGRPAATVSFITDDQVLLSQDRVVDADTGEAQSRIIELPLER